METSGQRWFARVLFLVLVGCGLAFLGWRNPSSRISTDVLDLIPARERQPELNLVRSLASERQGRVALFSVDLPEAVEASAGLRAAAALAFAKELQASGAFEEVLPMGGEGGGERRIGRFVYEHRFELLMPGWLERHLARAEAQGVAKSEVAARLATWAVDELDQFMEKPEAVAFQEVLPRDPLLLLPGLVERVQGVGLPSADKVGLVWAVAKANPFREEGQGPVFAAVEKAQAAAARVDARVTLRWTSVARFAAASRERIERELSWLNALSLVAVAAVAALGLSRIWKAFHLLPAILAGLLGAWCATFLFFDRVHVLVFVVGSLLGGVAIDYGFYLYLQAPIFPGEPYSGKVRRLLKPLLASALTTILGFSMLLLSDLPLIRQLGVFVSAGLLASLLASLLWFAQLKEHHLPARALAARPLPRGRGFRRLAQGLLCAGVFAALVGPWRLDWRDDIRELETPSPGLRENDRALRELFGERSGRLAYLTRGETLAEAREAWERLALKLGETRVPVSLALLFPREAQWRVLPERLEKLGDFPAVLAAELARRGYEAPVFAPFAADWKTWVAKPHETYEPAMRGLARLLEGPPSLLMGTSPGNCWFASLVPAGSEPVEVEGSVPLSQLESLNRLFSQYRLSALRLSLVGLGLVGLSVFILYGLRRGLRTFAIPAGSCLAAYGVLGLCGCTLNLFHLLGAFLGVCLSHNYAIFSMEGLLSGGGLPPSIRLSALTTAASFGVLALSGIPVVAALGASVSLIVVSALLLVELEPVVFGGP